MGYSRADGKKFMQKYPKDCISLGHAFQKINAIGSITEMMLTYNGNVTDSKGKILWQFEIHCEFAVNKAMLPKSGSDEQEVKDFMAEAFTKANEAFKNHTSNDHILISYFLCAEDGSTTPLSLF